MINYRIGQTMVPFTMQGKIDTLIIVIFVINCFYSVIMVLTLMPLLRRCYLVSLNIHYFIIFIILYFYYVFYYYSLVCFLMGNMYIEEIDVPIGSIQLDPWVFYL